MRPVCVGGCSDRWRSGSTGRVAGPPERYGAAAEFLAAEGAAAPPPEAAAVVLAADRFSQRRRRAGYLKILNQVFRTFLAVGLRRVLFQAFAAFLRISPWVGYGKMVLANLPRPMLCVIARLSDPIMSPA